MIAVGERIRMARGHRTQAEFADMIGVSRSSLSNYEAGRQLPSGDVLERIAASVNMTPEWILAGQPGSEPVQLDDQQYKPSDISALWTGFDFLTSSGKETARQVIIMSLKNRVSSLSLEHRKQILQLIRDIERIEF